MPIQIKGTEIITDDSVLKNLAGIFETRVNITATSGAGTLNLNLGNYFTRTISGASSFTLLNVSATNTVSSFILELTNGGSATVSWFTNSRWVNGSPPTLTSSGKDVLGFYTYDGGANWIGLLLGKDVK
jgi:hypothetical protein